MSAVLYQLTVIDNKGKVFREETYVSPSVLVKELPRIRDAANKWLMDNDTQDFRKKAKLDEKN